MRLQLALNVPDIDQAVAYYRRLFGVEPHKRRDGYANFAIDEPPLKLVLFENPGSEEHLNHLGVEVFDPDDVEAARERLERAGILGTVQRETRCCHATQDKVWSTPHDGLPWEWYRIVDDDPAVPDDTLGRTCCTGKNGTENVGAS